MTPNPPKNILNATTFERLASSSGAPFDIVGAMIASFASAFEQNKRLLKLQIGNGEKYGQLLLPQSVEGHEALSEVYTDKMGRIRVQFHWQRPQEHPGYGANLDERSSCWLRVTYPSAGAGWGSQFIPRVGQEVLVTFIEGDIDRPIIVGVVHNGVQPNPNFSGVGALPANRALSDIKTKEHYGTQYSELLFDDTPGEVRAKLSSEHGKTQLNQGYLTHPRKDVRHAASHSATGPASFASQLPGMPQSALKTNERIAFANSAGKAIPSVAYEVKNLKGEMKGSGASDTAGATSEVAGKVIEPLMAHVNIRQGILVADATGGITPEQAQMLQQKYDEQIKFVDKKGNVLKGVGYDVYCDDDVIASGTTDTNGLTSRIVTAQPLPITRAVLTLKTMNGCCGNTPQEGSTTVTVNVEMEGASTNPQDVGRSVFRQVVEFHKRSLTAGEIQMAQTVFRNSIDYSKVLVHNHGYWLLFGFQPENTAVTPNGEMYFPEPIYSADFSVADNSDKAFFIHEITAVQNSQTLGNEALI